MSFVYSLTIKNDGSATLKKVEGEVGKLKNQLDEAGKKAEFFNKEIIGSSTVGSLLSNALTKASGIVWKFGKEMVNSYDSASKLSANIGITAESVLGLRHAAELSAVGSEAMDKNMAKLSRTMYETATGNKSAQQSFAKLGIEVTKSDGSLKKSDQVLMEMADKFKALPSGAARAAQAMDIFGKSGASMVSMLKDGSGALKEMVDEGTAAAGNVASIAESMEIGRAHV
jgi:hypothetical protein